MQQQKEAQLQMPVEMELFYAPHIEISRDFLESNFQNKQIHHLKNNFYFKPGMCTHNSEQRNK